MILYGASLPASFCLRELHEGRAARSYLKIRMDWLYSIYVIFLVAVIVRYLWLLSQSAARQGP